MIEEISNNKKALFDYTVLEKYEAGVELLGSEVKSIKFGRVNLKGSFVAFKNNEAFVLNLGIPLYQKNNLKKDLKEDRTRRLLLTKKEINYLYGQSQAGLTIIPISVIIKDGWVKLIIALAKGKQLFDKRETIKKREWTRLRRSIEAKSSK